MHIYTGSVIPGILAIVIFLNDVAFGHKELWQTFVADSLSNVMAYGHHKLWWPLSMNSLSVNFQMLLSLATMNYGGRMTQIASL